VKWLSNIFGLALVGLFLFVGVAAAASLGLTSGQLGAGSAAVSGCTASSLTATRNVNSSGSWDLRNVAKTVDWIDMMSFDYHGSFKFVGTGKKGGY